MNNSNFSGKIENFPETEKAPNSVIHLSSSQIHLLQSQIRRFKDLTTQHTESKIPKLGGDRTHLPTSNDNSSKTFKDAQSKPIATGTQSTKTVKLPELPNRQNLSDETQKQSLSSTNATNPSSNSNVVTVPSVPNPVNREPTRLWQPSSALYYCGPRQLTEGMVAASTNIVSLSNPLSIHNTP